jgi:hypothetical protein
MSPLRGARSIDLVRLYLGDSVRATATVFVVHGYILGLGGDDRQDDDDQLRTEYGMSDEIVDVANAVVT